MTTPADSTKGLEKGFKEGYQLFRTTLPQDVQSQLQKYGTAEAMIVAIRRHIDTVTDGLEKGSLNRCFSGFRNIARLIELYFQIVDIFCADTPLVPGPFLGLPKVASQGELPFIPSASVAKKQD
jgi:hypothetical protein